MSVIGTNALTFADWAARYGADTNVGEQLREGAATDDRARHLKNLDMPEET